MHRVVIAVLALCLGMGDVAVAQTDTTVVAGARYRGGWLREGLLGTDYRDLWSASMRVEVLDLDSFAGGLSPVRKGGGKQTTSLRLRGADGREYMFRSVDKAPSLTDEPALRNTPVGDVIQDQVSSLHPAAALVVAPLLDAVGVLHVSPRLVVMPDAPELGEFREEFAGMLGLLEERPNELEGEQPGFGGFPRITGTERLLERLEEEPDHRVDSREYLKARLMDLLFGDWDRHADQWRWAEDPRGEVTYWLPIPRDRDYAFVNYDGLLPGVARRFIPNAVRFGPKINNVYGLTINAQSLDRRLLADLERPVYDSLATVIQQALTDSVIADAARRMPPEYATRSADRLTRTLQSRRDGLDDAAKELYRLFSTEVEIHATDEPDLLVVDRTADDVVEVRLFVRRGDAQIPEGEPYFRRRFRASETNEVRVDLHGGDDYAVVRGDVRESLMVRVIGGGGDDVMMDSSRVRADRGETAFYDARGDNRFVRGPHTQVDERDYDAPSASVDLSGQGFRDWGSQGSWIPGISYQSPDGVILSLGRSYTRFGFRQEPYAFRLSARARVAPGSGNVAVETMGDWRPIGSPWAYSARFLASQLEVLRFFGYGNDTPAEEASSRYVIPQDQVLLHAAAAWRLPRGGTLALGPVVKYLNPDVPDDHPVGVLPPYGSSGFGQAGALLELEMDLRDEKDFPRKGLLLSAGASGYPEFWDVGTPFLEAHARTSAYLPLPLPHEVILALRTGGHRIWGDFPVHEAAFLGGSSTLRGYSYQRFAGDALLFGNAELRTPLARVELLVRGDLGVLALADAGRVWMDGASPGGWHTALGAGMWFRFRIRDDLTTLSLTYARGEKGRFYFKFRIPF